ncbi:hypothetical protein [Lysinibacillus sp. G4S2]|uniref:hypothetical protein n=1 Tax=Lysinibacillus sp. G4S2 TaxID=3055859 RepID=UPI0025A1F054|nr:hypothetical protein [Lysinibacillus sp. G4S2]MDM5250076.1 hypothetical protein [Lysinibacillus sp. G4S2]
MISNQETLHLSPYMSIYDIVVPKDNMLRQINELVDQLANEILDSLPYAYKMLFFIAIIVEIMSKIAKK